jgi:hypothetical protein
MAKRSVRAKNGKRQKKRLKIQIISTVATPCVDPPKSDIAPAIVQVQPKSTTQRLLEARQACAELRLSSAKRSHK